MGGWCRCLYFVLGRTASVDAELAAIRLDVAHVCDVCYRYDMCRLMVNIDGSLPDNCCAYALFDGRLLCLSCQQLRDHVMHEWEPGEQDVATGFITCQVGQLHSPTLLYGPLTQVAFVHYHVDELLRGTDE